MVNSARHSVDGVLGEPPEAFPALLVTLAWVRSERAMSTRLNRQAGRDDDVQLKAYDAHLTALSKRSRHGTPTPPKSAD